METEVITAVASLGEYGAIGVTLLSVIAIVAVVVVTFRFNADQSKLNRESIEEQSRLNRDSHKENTKIMSSALGEVTAVVGRFASDNRADHVEMKGTNNTILNELRNNKSTNK